MSGLHAKLASFKSEQVNVAARNIAHSRPQASSTPARTSTPQPAGTNDSTKRTHADAFSGELVALMGYARSKLREKNPQTLTFDEIVKALSVPNDSKQTIPRIKQALMGDKHIEWIPATAKEPDLFKYKPLHPVTNAEELKDYLAKRTTADGILAKEIKDGWPDCVEGINQLEKEGFVLVTRNKKDNTPKLVYPDSPSLHIEVDQDFKDLWHKTKVPSSETELRLELEKAQLTPTSQVKEIVKGPMRKKERKRPNRRGGKITNSHMSGILRENIKR